LENKELLMDEYRTYVQRLADLADGKEVILNRTTDHAAVIMSVVFAKAERLVEIVSGRLDDDIWGVDDVRSQAIAFLNRSDDTKIRIIVEDNIDLDTNRLVSSIRAAGLIGRLKIFHATDELLKTYDYHFIVADGLHYRFQGERDKFEAIIQFGNVDRGQKLRAVFASLRSNSVELPLPNPIQA